MTQKIKILEDRALIRKFWRWHKVRVDKANTKYDLDYLEKVEDMILMCESYYKAEYVQRKALEKENQILLLRIENLKEQLSFEKQQSDLFLRIALQRIKDLLRIKNKQP
ncbi:MAG: hypothetical protein ACOVQ4_20960 [Flectobacillus sp.]|uniref:hypothetical protein n=1 Tax=Flectobacillus sp. TaxID=50419 RepID=UPI003B9ADCD5